MNSSHPHGSSAYTPPPGNHWPPVGDGHFSPPPQRAPRKGLNVLGLIALVLAVLGFIFACVPGALIVGWVLLPIAFILSLVSLFLQHKSKWMGVTALVLSVVGTLVGVLVFIFLLGSAFDNAFTGDGPTVTQPGASTSADRQGGEQGANADEGSRSRPYPVGSTIESGDWRVVVNSVELNATPAIQAENPYNEAPAKGKQYVMVNYSVTYLGKDPNGQAAMGSTVAYVTPEGNTINSFDKAVVAPEAFDPSKALYEGATETGNVVFEVPSATAGEGVLAVQSNFMDRDKVFVAVS